MKGYKAFDKNLTCRGMQYEIGKSYKLDGKLQICKNGFHFCKTIADCYRYYDMSEDTRICEVKVTGNVITDDNVKFCTDEICIKREIKNPREKTNVSNSCSGDWNSGDCNSGNCNSGNRNCGDCNSGNWNSGNRNSGDWNSGNRNSGNCNSGDCNSGDCNSGNWNSGNWNSGFFNSNEPNIRMFNKGTNLKRDEIDIPSWCYFDLTVWVSHDTATEQEKEIYKKEIETNGGYLKTLEYKEAWRLAWGKSTKEEHEQLLKLPNWDNEVFKEITGIDAEAEIAKE